MGGVVGWGCAMQNGGVGTVLAGAEGTPGGGAWMKGVGFALVPALPCPAQVEPSPALTQQLFPFRLQYVWSRLCLSFSSLIPGTVLQGSRAVLRAPPEAPRLWAHLQSCHCVPNSWCIQPSPPPPPSFQPQCHHQRCANHPWGLHTVGCSWLEAVQHRLQQAGAQLSCMQPPQDVVNTTAHTSHLFLPCLLGLWWPGTHCFWTASVVPDLQMKEVVHARLC